MDLKPNIDLIRFKEYYEMPKGYEHDPLHSLSIINTYGLSEFQCIFLGKKVIIITSKHGTTIFFPITIFFYEDFKKKCRKRRS